VRDELKSESKVMDEIKTISMYVSINQVFIC